MTPQGLAELVALLIELRRWLDEVDPYTLDTAIVTRTIAVCVERRAELVREGAR